MHKLRSVPTKSTCTATFIPDPSRRQISVRYLSELRPASCFCEVDPHVALLGRYMSKYYTKRLCFADASSSESGARTTSCCWSYGAPAVTFRLTTKVQFSLSGTKYRK